MATPREGIAVRPVRSAMVLGAREGEGGVKRTALRRSTPLARKSRLRPVSRKRARVQRERRAFVSEVLAEGPLCEIRWDANCRGRADGVHEVVKRSHGGALVPGAKAEAQGQRFVAACHYCNGAVEDHPAEARERGWA